MSESTQYKTLLACFDKLVDALKQDPVTIWNELASAYLIAPPDGPVQLIEAQQLTRCILNIVKVEPTRYDDVMKVLSKHDWLRDIVKILHTTYDKHTNERKETVTGASKGVKLLSRGGAEAICKDDIPWQCEYPHTSSSLRIPNPIVNLGDLCEDDCENLYAQMSDLTVNINKNFKKLLNQVYESFRQRIHHSSVILTLTQDDVMIFDHDVDICGAKDMFEVFIKAVRPHCSYFNYELLKLLVDIHGSPEDKAHMDEYLRSFMRYCEAMPCAEEICGNDDSDSRRIKLKFKINFDRQRLKPEVLRRIKYNIAHHLKIQPCSLYLCSVKEGCVLLEFLMPSFLLKRVFPLSNAQKAALYSEWKVTAIRCDDPRFHLVIDVSKQDAPPPPVTKPIPEVTVTIEQLNHLKELVLLEKIGYLCEELGDPGRYFPELRTKNILNTVDTQLIKSRPTHHERMDEFVTLISKRRNSHGQHGLDVFVEALKKQRVHAHVARTLLRAFNKKKAEVVRKNSGDSNLGTYGPTLNKKKTEAGHNKFLSPLDIDDGYSTYYSSGSSTVISSLSYSSDNTTSSELEFHPEHGALPPSPLPTSTQEDNTPSEPDGNVHPSYGLVPCPPPPTSTNQNEVYIDKEQETQQDIIYPDYGVLPSLPCPTSSNLELESFQSLPLPVASIDDTAKLDVLLKVDACSTTSCASSRDNTAELETLRKAFENLKFEKHQLELRYYEANRLILALQIENAKLQEQLYLLQHHQHQRPSNLRFHPATAGGQSQPSYYYSSQGSDSLTPPTGQGAQSTRNPSSSSGPGPVGEKDLLPRNSESADSSGSVSSHKSQDWKQLL